MKPKVKEVINKNNTGGSIQDKEERVMNLFDEIFKERTPQTEEVRKGSRKTKKNNYQK